MALDLVHLVGQLVDAGVRFVAIGGVAVGVHGHVRMTLDLDVVPDPERRNLERLVVAVSRMEARLPAAGGRRFDPAADAQALRRGGNLTLDTPHGGLDVVQRLPGLPTYSALAADAEEVRLQAHVVAVCSLPHLRAMKEAAGRPQDVADLTALPEP